MREPLNPSRYAPTCLCWSVPKYGIPVGGTELLGLLGIDFYSVEQEKPTGQWKERVVKNKNDNEGQSFPDQVWE